MNTEEVLAKIKPLNDDEIFYKEYYAACKSPAGYKSFLASINPEEIIKRHLVVPEVMPEIISYDMEDAEYFKDDDPISVYISRHNRYTPPFLHKHAFFEIVHVLSGRCIQIIDNQALCFQTGDICFIAPGTYHTMEVFDDETLVFNILLRKKTFYQMFTPLTLGSDLLSKFFSEGLYGNHKIEYLIFHTAKDPFYSQRMLEMYGEQLERDVYTDQILVGMLTESQALMMRHFKDTMESSHSMKQGSTQEEFRFLNYIQEHLADLTLSELAEHFGYSVSHSSRMIKSYTGQGFSEWKRTLRIRRAEHMLLNSDTAVVDISASLGYLNPETFIRAFKKEIHMTPSEYRNQAKR